MENNGTIIQLFQVFINFRALLLRNFQETDCVINTKIVTIQQVFPTVTFLEVEKKVRQVGETLA